MHLNVAAHPTDNDLDSRFKSGERTNVLSAAAMNRRVMALSAVLVLLATAAAVHAQDRGTALGGLEFGSKPEKVAATLSELGLAISTKPQDKRFPFDQMFEGKLKGRTVRVTTWYAPQASLEKMSVVFLTGNEECLEFYRGFKQYLISQHGQTRVDVEHWREPYNDGYHVGHEETARGLVAEMRRLFVDAGAVDEP